MPADADADVKAREATTSTGKRTAQQSRAFISVPLGNLGAREHELLLIGGGHLLVEVVKIVVVLRCEQREVEGCGAAHTHHVPSWICRCLEYGVTGPGYVRRLGCGFEREFRWQVVGDLVLLHARIVDVYWHSSFVLRDKWMFRVSFEEHLGQKKALSSESSKITRDLDD